MPRGKKRGRGKKSRRNGKGSGSPAGTMQRPPKLSQGLQVRNDLTPRRTIVRRVYKWRVLFSTTGTQTFGIYSFYLWSPFQSTLVTVGSVVGVSSLPTLLNDMLAVFAYYKVRRIGFQWESNISSTVAFPSCVVAMNPALTPQLLGTTGAAYNLTNSQQNSKQLDLHISNSHEWRVPKPTELVDASGTTEIALLAGSWIPAEYATNNRAITDPGIITCVFGDSVLAAPLTTSAGVMTVIYDMAFMLPQ